MISAAAVDGDGRRSLPRVAAVFPYWTFWEHSSGVDLRSDREALARRLLAGLASTVDVVSFHALDSPEAGAQAGREIAAGAAQALLVLQSMAVPPRHVLEALRHLPSLPVVVWTVHSAARLRPGFDHGDITREGATVGAPMLTNTLVRESRPFELCIGTADDAGTLAKVSETLRLAAVASSLSQARIGRVGLPIPGYDCVDADDERLQAATGIILVPIAPDEVADRFRAVAPDRVRAEMQAVREIGRAHV